MYDKFDKQKPFALLDTSKYPPEVVGRFNSFITTQFDDSLSVEMQIRSIIKWAIDNFKEMDQTYNDFTEYVVQGNLNPFIQFLNDLIEYMNDFIETFDEKYQETILDKMQEWYDNGELETLINESLDTKYHEMDERITTQLAQTDTEVSIIRTSKMDKSEGATKQELNNQLANIVNGSPKGTFTTLARLKDEYPNGAEGIYVVTADGNWYYWNSTVWVSGGVYQATQLSDEEFYEKAKGIGEVKYVGDAPVDISSLDRKITFPSYDGGASILIINGKEYVLSVNNSVISIPEGLYNGKLLFNTQSSTFRVATMVSSLTEHEYVVMVFRLLSRNIVINGDYSFNGVSQKGVTEETLVSRTRGVGYVRYVSSDPVIITYPENKITFPTGLSSLLINGLYYNIDEGVSVVDIPSGLFNGKLFFNIAEETFKVVENSVYPRENEYLVMAFRLLEKKVFFDGDVIFNGIDKTVVTKNDILGGKEVKCVSNGVTNVDTTLREVVFPSDHGERTWFFVGGEGFELDTTNSKVNFPTANVGSVCIITFNIKTKELKSRRWSEKLEVDEYNVMAINALTRPFDVSFNGAYTVDGATKDEESIDEIKDDLSLSIVAYNFEDMINSWWTNPLAVRHIGHRDKTYLGYTDSQGYTGAASINNESGQEIKKRLKKRDIDDHNASAVEVMDDGRVMCVYSSGHNQDNYLTVRLSSKIESVEEFDEDIKILSEGTTTYAQLFKKSGKYFIFFRTRNQHWSYTSSDNGEDWSEPIVYLIGGMQYYCKVVDTTDDNLLRIVMYSNPNETDSNMRLGFFDTTTNEFKLKDGTVVGTEGISKDAFPIILPVEEGKKQRLLDVAITDVDTTIIAYATFTDYVTARNDWQDVIYKVANHHQINGLNTTTLTYGGKPFYYFSVYVGGMVFGYDENTIFMSRQDENGIWYIEKWETADQLTWAMSESIHQAKEGSVAIRPTLEKDGDKVIWQEGFYNPTSFSDNNVDYKYKKVRNLM